MHMHLNTDLFFKKTTLEGIYCAYSYPYKWSPMHYTYLLPLHCACTVVAICKESAGFMLLD